MTRTSRSSSRSSSTRSPPDTCSPGPVRRPRAGPPAEPPDNKSAPIRPNLESALDQRVAQSGTTVTSAGQRPDRTATDPAGSITCPMPWSTNGHDGNLPRTQLAAPAVVGMWSPLSPRLSTGSSTFAPCSPEMSGAGAMHRLHQQLRHSGTMGRHASATFTTRRANAIRRRALFQSIEETDPPPRTAAYCHPRFQPGHSSPIMTFGTSTASEKELRLTHWQHVTEGRPA